MVGKTGRRQAITLASGCWTNGIVAHEIGKLYELCEPFLYHYESGIRSNQDQCRSNMLILRSFTVQRFNFSEYFMPSRR